jgi:hypothetical protein
VSFNFQDEDFVEVLKKKRRRFVVVMVSNSRSASSSAQSHATEAEANQCIINPNHVPETREAI